LVESVEDELLVGKSDEGGVVDPSGDRKVSDDAFGSGGQITLPPDLDEREAHLQQGRVWRRRSAAVRDRVEYRAIPAGGFHRPEDFHGRRIRYPPLRVSRRAVQIDDDPIPTIGRIDLSVEHAPEPLVLTNALEDAPAQCGSLHHLQLERAEPGSTQARAETRDAARRNQRGLIGFNSWGESFTGSRWRKSACAPRLTGTGYRTPPRGSIGGST
jgi:hypothetical protein